MLLVGRRGYAFKLFEKPAEIVGVAVSRHIADLLYGVFAPFHQLFCVVDSYCCQLFNKVNAHLLLIQSAEILRADVEFLGYLIKCEVLHKTLGDNPVGFVHDDANCPLFGAVDIARNSPYLVDHRLLKFLPRRAAKQLRQIARIAR